MPVASTLPEILDLLAGGSLVLTPNARAARALRFAFDAAQRARGLAAWQPPSVLAWTQFTSSLWNDLILAGVESRLLLNEAQEHSLWREIIAAGPDADLSSADPLADLAQSAWTLASAWNATPKLQALASNRDTRLFAAWADAFTKLCTTHLCLAPAQLDNALRVHLESGSFPAPAALHLIDFAPPLPSRQSLLEALASRGCEVVHHTFTSAPHAGPLHASTVAPSERDELTLAARWIRRFLEDRTQLGQSASVAVLVPTVSDERPALEAVFRDVLAPELHAVTADLSSTPWEFSTGSPLLSLRMIADALDLARWSLGPLPLGRVSSLLLSPYLGRAEDRNAAAAFDAHRLRRSLLLRPEIDLPSLLDLAARHPNTATALQLPPWLTTVRQFLANADLAKPRTFAAWSEFLRALIHAANWPGDRPLSPGEFEATRAWESTLDLLATLDFAGRRVPLSAALHALDRQVRAAAFTPPSTHAAVQIMGPEEATGSSFDAVVFLRATDANWPRSAHPHPLLPWTLQQILSMPGTSPAQSFAVALDFTQRLLDACPVVLFTSAAQNADGQLRPSPVLTQLSLPQVPPDTLLAPIADPAPLPTETIFDEVPLPPLPSTEVAGGSNILKLQAACGFLAFAELRLLSTELESRSAGLDPRESGNLLHKTLQLFWNRIPSRDALARLSPLEREQTLAACIDAAVPARLRADGRWDLAYLQLQKDRVRQLLLHWLDHELTRGPFTVLESEREEFIAVGPLTLRIRMDRIDQVPADPLDPENPARGFVYVDYKTGYRSKAADWEGPRPDDPQLPLYALTAQPGELMALVFAKVRAGKDARWTGYQSTLGIFPGSPARTVVNLDEKSLEWRNTLTRLAEDFHAGRAAVSPKSFDLNCAHCAQRLLCRVDPESLLAQVATAEDDSDPDGESDG